MKSKTKFGVVAVVIAVPLLLGVYSLGDELIPEAGANLGEVGDVATPFGAGNFRQVDAGTLNTQTLDVGGTQVFGDWSWSAYDPITAVGTTGSFAQLGATTGASTIRSCTFTPTTTPVGTGTETIELCNGTGITSSNCTGTKYCTCLLTSSSTALTPVTCTVNTSAVAAGANPTWTITADSLATSAGPGNASAKATQP